MDRHDCFFICQLIDIFICSTCFWTTLSYFTYDFVNRKVSRSEILDTASYRQLARSHNIFSNQANGPWPGTETRQPAPKTSTRSYDQSGILSLRVVLVDSMSASHTGGRGFTSLPGHTKDHHKNGTNCLPALHVCVRVRVWQCSLTV